MSAQIQELPLKSSDYETTTALAHVNQTIIELDKFEAGIAELKKRYGDVVYACQTPKGLKEATEARLACRKPRFATQNALKDAKKPLTALGKALTAHGERIIEGIFAIEDPIDGQIKAEETRLETIKAGKARIERERVAALLVRYDALRLDPVLSALSDPEVIAEHIQHIRAIVVDDSFDEFLADAVDRQESTLKRLWAMHTEATEYRAERARLKEEREELDRQKAALAREQTPPSVMRGDSFTSDTKTVSPIAETEEYLPPPEAVQTVARAAGSLLYSAGRSTFLERPTAPQAAAHVAQRPATTLEARPPSGRDIIRVIADHYMVRPRKAVEWLLMLDLEALKDIENV